MTLNCSKADSVWLNKTLINDVVQLLNHRLWKEQNYPKLFQGRRFLVEQDLDQ